MKDLKDICFSGHGVPTGFNITSEKLAKLVGLSVEAVEAMTKDDLKALMLENKHILNQAFNQADDEDEVLYWYDSMIFNMM